MPDREATETTRRRIADALRAEALTPGALAATFEVSTGTALDHVEHLSHTLDGTDEELLVRPPECIDCGFDEFDDLVNVPSRCPQCKSESIREPAFRID